MAKAKHGSTNDDFTLNVDLAPTIRNIKFIPSSEALVRKDWKYFYWPDFQREQLFDMTADPMEENDLAADPAQSERLADTRDRFAELKAKAR